MKKTGIFFIFFSLLIFSSPISLGAENENSSANEKVWMKHPGDVTGNWESQIFLLGNGYFGVSCYGGIQQEVLNLAEKTFWTGGPGDSDTNNYGIYRGNQATLFDSIKKYTKVGDVANSDRLIGQFLSDAGAWDTKNTYGSLSSIGELVMNFEKEMGAVHGYTRTLNLDNSTVFIKYFMNNINFSREYFCSYPDRVLAMRMTADKPKAMNFTVGFKLMHKQRNPRMEVSAENGTIEISGNIDDNNRPYRIILKVVNQGGEVQKLDGGLKICGSNSVDLYYTVATNYVQKPPLYKGADPESITRGVMRKVLEQGYERTRELHIADYQSLYNRTRFHMENGAKEREALPTNDRLNYYIQQNDYKDLGLKELAFNFGKYILISASRPGALPAGLCGAWNPRYHSLWNGSYQLDMNTTQTYMFGNALNLPECQQPFIDWLLNDKVITGKEICKAVYGKDDYWSTFMIGNIWGHAGILPCLEHKFYSTGWMSLILWEQYAFEGDMEYLKKIYSVLKEAALFYLDNLVEYKNSGKLVVFGTASAEHRSPLGATLPGYQDIAFVHETFDNVITASEILNVDKSFRKKLLKCKNRLMPYKVGRLGQFQEWVEDVDDPNCQHRHISHLLGLLPCKQLNPYKYPELAKAMKVSLTLRGDADFISLNGIGCNNNKEHATKCYHEGLPYDTYTSQVWCRAARLCNWVRLFDGNKSDKIYNDIFRESTLGNMMQYETRAHYGDPYPITPFFLDGTVLSAGYVTEMVLQSQYGFLDLLPALPSAWKTGYLKGIRARGGFTVDVEWKNGSLVKAVIKSDKDKTCKIHYKGQYYEKMITKDEPYVFKDEN